MHKILFGLFLLVTPLSAIANDLCDELWLSRNRVFDRLDFCFKSELGKATFDNSDCIEGTPKPNVNEQRIIDLVHEVEAEWSCNINTNRTILDVNWLQLHDILRDIPVRSGNETGCLEWRAGATSLRSGRSDKASVTGVIVDYDDVLLNYVDIDDWHFILMTQENFGWIRVEEIDRKSCTEIVF